MRTGTINSLASLLRDGGFKGSRASVLWARENVGEFPSCLGGIFWCLTSTSRSWEVAKVQNCWVGKFRMRHITESGMLELGERGETDT